MLHKFCDKYGRVYPMEYEDDISKEEAQDARGLSEDVDDILFPLALDYNFRVLDEDTRKKLHEKYFYLFREPRCINIIPFTLRMYVCSGYYHIVDEWGESLDLYDYFVSALELCDPNGPLLPDKTIDMIRYETNDEAKYRIIHYYTEFVKKYYKKYPWYIRLENHLLAIIFKHYRKLRKQHNMMISMKPNALVRRMQHRFFGPEFKNVPKSYENSLGQIYWR